MAFKSMSLENLKRFANNLKSWANDSFVAKETGKGLSEANYTETEKTKLQGIAAGAQVNVIETIKVNGAAQAVSDKAINIDLSGYALKTDVSSALDWKGTKSSVSELPASGNKTGDMWHVADKSAEYVWNGSAWEEVGSIVDLSGYYTKTETNTAITNAVATKADKSTFESEIQRIDGVIASLDIPEGVIVDSALSTTSTNAIANKAVTAELNLKATKEEVGDLNTTLTTAIGKKVDQTAYDTKIGTIESTLNGKANAGDVYTKTQTYTKTEVDAAIDADVGVVDTRVTTEVGAINTTLAGKADTTYVNTQLDLKVNAADIVAFTESEIDSATA